MNKASQAVVSAFFMLLLSDLGLAQSQFYQGKTVKIIYGSNPGGTGDMRVRAVVAVLKKHIPGNPTIVVDYMAGGGGRKAANHIFAAARPDGLTIGAMLGGLVPSAILGETGVLYDLDRFVYLGSPDSATQYVFLTRNDAGLNSLEKLQSAPGVRLGAQSVGHSVYIMGRTFAYLIGMREPKFVTGYSGTELDLAVLRGEVDGRANIADTIVRRNLEWIQKDLVHFHSIVEIPKGNKHPRFNNLPEIESFARTEKERKLLALLRGFRMTGLPYILPPGSPKEQVQILQEAMRRTLKDPEFFTEYKKLAGEEPTPLMPDMLAHSIKELPRERDIIELFKKLSGADPLPHR
ncbi:MAG: hypothetical protein HY695_00945 [Deltaproteobacteria bacterium]|nr:hypothetical protein [Deltaproteobacteria bacterium]